MLTLLSLAASGACTGDGPRQDEPRPAAGEASTTVPTAEERAQGFRALFDGTSLDAWRGYRQDGVPGGWSIEDGTLAFDPAGGRGDLITREQFADFELRLEWRVSPGGNSGVFFRVQERHEWPRQTGPEMQILDNAGHPDGQSPLTAAGSNFALHGPVEDVTRPVGEWNEARLVVAGLHVEHWLNGRRIIEYELWTPAWVDAVSGSKFAEMPDYGLARSGHIGLQDHGDRVWFRDIRIRPLGGEG